MIAVVLISRHFWPGHTRPDQSGHCDNCQQNQDSDFRAVHQCSSMNASTYQPRDISTENTMNDASAGKKLSCVIDL